MNSRINSQITPRNGDKLIVGVVARISGCANQKTLSLEDQQDHAKKIVQELYQGEVEYRTIATKGKGERLDRPELRDIEEMLRTGELDLLIAEDTGRVIRGAAAVRLFGIAVDHGTRVLAPNDCIDTSEDSWEEDVIAACRDHVGHNSHTSKRLKQKLMNRFVRFGGATAREIYGYITPPKPETYNGYIKPLKAVTYNDWQKDPAATQVFAKWLRILQDTRNCSAVAEYLNHQGVPPGKYSRRKTWDGATVRRITRNPLLKGMPGRGFKYTVKHHETGRRVAVKNPDGPKFWECPHLAHWDPQDFDEINALLDEANRGRGRKPVNGHDPLWRVPRKRTRFPGQHARCWYCGRQCVWGGNGMKDNLMCNGSRYWACWNSIGFSGALAAQKVVEAITTELAALDGFDDQFREIVETASRASDADPARVGAELDREEKEVMRKQGNLLAAIAEYGPKPEFPAKLTELEAQRRELSKRRRNLERLRDQGLNLPRSIADLRRMFDERFLGLAHESPELGDLLRLVVPQFHVYLVRVCDGGHLLPRARVTLNLGGIVPDTKHVPAMESLLTRVLTLDLFEPPQRERIRKEVVRLAAEGLEQRQIALQLPEKPTQAAVSKAYVLARMMKERGLETPFEIVMEPPPDYLKLRRHLNSKYSFQVEEGYQRPSI